MEVFNPLNSHEWPRQNFSLQYQYNIKQTSDENKEKYQLGDYKLIQYQIRKTNITRTVRQTVRRITKGILGIKGLRICITRYLKENKPTHGEHTPHERKWADSSVWKWVSQYFWIASFNILLRVSDPNN